jgi:hypothetical protein
MQGTSLMASGLQSGKYANVSSISNEFFQADLISRRIAI